MGNKIAADRRLTASSLESGTLNADVNVASKDYIESGIAALEDMLAEKAASESLAFA